MAGEFKVGDIVQLKSGGPKMTIYKLETFDGAERANCQWFEGNKPMSSMFVLATLKPADEMAGRGQAGGPDSWMRQGNRRSR